MKKLMLALMAVTVLSGCSSIVKGSRQIINISTSTGKQAPAIITTDEGQQTLTLPHAVTVKDSSKDIVVNIKETKCNNPSSTVIHSRLHPWFWGNIILGGVIGSTTDAVTGSMWAYDENTIVDVTEKEICEVK